MKPKILLWTDDSSYLQFCFSTFIKEKTNCEISIIADVNKYGKQFLQSQTLLKPDYIWFFRDFFLGNKSPADINYLKQFEEKYKINLWLIIYSERLFYNYTIYYKPTKNEILQIVEIICKNFENILQKLTPDFLFIKNTDNIQTTLLFELAKSMKIKILTFASSKLANVSHISLDADKIDQVINNQIQQDKIINIQEYFDNHDPYKQDEKKKKLEMPTLTKRIAFFFKYLVTQNESKTYFSNHGRNSFNFILKNIPLVFISYYRKEFLARNSIKTLEHEHFIYFPLHVEPERSILISAPFYSDQINIITNIAKSLPFGYKLYVKEHGSMALYHWRKTSFYKNITKLPNVKLIHPSVNPRNLLEKCKLVITIAGTIGIEALFFNKPVLVFADVLYSSLPTVFRVKNYDELPKLIRDALSIKPQNEGSIALMDLYNENCIDIDMIDLQHECLKFIGPHGINDFVMPTENKISQFIRNNKEKLEAVAVAHMERMKQYRDNLIKIGDRNDVMKHNL